MKRDSILSEKDVTSFFERMLVFPKKMLRLFLKDTCISGKDTTSF